MSNLELKVNRTYRAKKPKEIGFFERYIDDRVIVYMDFNRVQYDSPSVRIGRKLPFVKKEAFLKWADKDVTDLLPKGEWERVK